MYPEKLKYIQSHIWVEIEKGIATVGITSFPLELYGEFLYVDMPEIGIEVEQLQEIGSLETSKEVFTIHAPLSGEIIKINEDINESNMDLINESPYEDGWLFKIKLSDENEIEDLISSEEYENHIESITYELDEDDADVEEMQI